MNEHRLNKALIVIGLVSSAGCSMFSSDLKTHQQIMLDYQAEQQAQEEAERAAAERRERERWVRYCVKIEPARSFRVKQCFEQGGAIQKLEFYGVVLKYESDAERDAILECGFTRYSEASRQFDEHEDRVKYDSYFLKYEDRAEFLADPDNSLDREKYITDRMNQAVLEVCKDLGVVRRRK